MVFLMSFTGQFASPINGIYSLLFQDVPVILHWLLIITNFRPYHLSLRRSLKISRTQSRHYSAGVVVSSVVKWRPWRRHGGVA
ncbi:hypothetical protein JHK87_016912 [Glycine soja]|nr:hypothetical protein JHK87_016912 [Glycine soja]